MVETPFLGALLVVFKNQSGNNFLEYYITVKLENQVLFKKSLTKIVIDLGWRDNPSTPLLEFN